VADGVFDAGARIVGRANVVDHSAGKAVLRLSRE
jgi:hypothetical protein